MKRPPPPVPDAIPVAHEIFRRMIDAGMNQTELERAAGLKKNYVRNIYKGVSRAPGAEHLAKIAQALNCQLDDLIAPRRAVSDQPAPQIGELPGEFDVLSESEKELIRIWRVLRKPARHVVLLSIAELLPDTASARKIKDF